MPFPPEPRSARAGAGTRLAWLAVSALVLVAVAAGCGKGDFRRAAGTDVPTVEARLPPRPASPRRAPNPRSAQGLPVPLPLALTRAQAEAFARAVTLHRADLPGATVAKRSKSSAAQEREAARCGGHQTVALGGASSPDFHRGAGLNRESISSSVQVLHDPGAVTSDLAYASSHAGLACYAKVLGKSLRGEQDTHVRLRGVRVGRVGVTLGPSERASGIRITAGVSILGTGVEVRLFVDALSLPYGPAELDVYSTSFVQPAPEKTERELLELLRLRALRQRL